MQRQSEIGWSAMKSASKQIHLSDGSSWQLSLTAVLSALRRAQLGGEGA
jgi:hypothetical protein